MGLTRRGLLGRAAATSAALLGAGLLDPRIVFAGQHGEAVFEMRVPADGRIATGRPFEMVGIERGVQAEVRARGLDGRWSGWMTLHPGHEDSVLSDPVWVGRSNALEIRAKRSLRGARLLCVDGGRYASASATRYIDTGLLAGAGQPQIISRSSWATSACRPRVAPVLGAIDVAFVHHTVNSNSYRASQSAAMVRSICLFHKYGNGWNDIGYNFVVDRHGQIFEGRAGGVDETIVGAQAGGYNFRSTGIALLGNFTYAGPPRGAFNSLAELLAWKLTLHGVEAIGRTKVPVSKQGSPYSRYRAGTLVTLNRIAGHRDGDTTTCPGSAMYRQLPRLRQAVENLVVDVASLTLAAQGAGPGYVTVGGMLSDSTGAVGGASIEVQTRSTTRGSATVATATTGDDGTWSVQVPLSANALLRALYRGDDLHPASISAGIAATVAPQIALNGSASTTVPGGVVDFSGQTTPLKPQVALVVSQQQLDGSLVEVQTIRVNTAADGTFFRSIAFPNPGQYQVIAHTSADSKNALGTSPPLTITVA